MKNNINSNILFSVVIPLYNKENYIAKTVNSVLKQTYNNFEIIIVNDGSTDNSFNTIKAINTSKIRLIDQDNQGVSVARNKGISASKGNYVVFLDADDSWYPNHLLEFKKAIEYYPNHIVFCTNYEFNFKNKETKHPKFSTHLNSDYTVISDFFKSSMKNCIAMTPAICIKKSILNPDFLFDPKIKSGQDTDLWIRLGLKFNFIFINKTTSKINRSVSNSLSKSNLIDHRYYMVKKNKNHNKNKSLNKYLDYNRFSIALQYRRAKEFKKFTTLTHEIDKKDLSLKQKIILQLPLCIIKILDQIK